MTPVEEFAIYACFYGGFDSPEIKREFIDFISQYEFLFYPDIPSASLDWRDSR